MDWCRIAAHLFLISPVWCMLNHSPWAAVCTGRSLWSGTGPWCSSFYGRVLVQEGGPCGGAGLTIVGRKSLALRLKRGHGSSRLRCRLAGPSIASRRRAASYRPCGCYWCSFSQAPCDSRLWGKRRPWAQRSTAGAWVVPSLVVRERGWVDYLAGPVDVLQERIRSLNIFRNYFKTSHELFLLADLK